MFLSGYASENDIDFVEEAHSATVNSCGHYYNLENVNFTTYRPNGRRDYQLLYVHSGMLHATVRDVWRTIPQGFALLYLPHEKQHYVYYVEDNPDVYWIHFTGREIPAMLEQCGFGGECVFEVGISNQYSLIFDRIIHELQIKHSHFEILCRLHCTEMLLTMSRFASQNAGSLSIQSTKIIDQAVQLFHMRYRDKLSIREYASANHISTGWFIRQFHARMGVTPQKYLTVLRINKAKELLLSDSYNISEAAEAVGYDNPLYFSRIFSRVTGCSPSEYRKNRTQ